MLLNRIKDINIDVDFKPNVKHTPVIIDKESIRLYFPQQNNKQGQGVIELSEHSQQQNKQIKNSSLDDALSLLEDDNPFNINNNQLSKAELIVQNEQKYEQELLTKCSRHSSQRSSLSENNLKQTINKNFSQLENFSRESNFVNDNYENAINISVPKIPKSDRKQLKNDLIVNPFAVFDDDFSSFSTDHHQYKKADISIQSSENEVSEIELNNQIISTNDAQKLNSNPKTQQQIQPKITLPQNIPKQSTNFHPNIMRNNEAEKSQSTKNEFLQLKVQNSSKQPTLKKESVSSQSTQNSQTNSDTHAIHQSQLYKDDKTNYSNGEAYLQNGEILMDYELQQPEQPPHPISPILKEESLLHVKIDSQFIQSTEQQISPKVTDNHSINHNRKVEPDTDNLQNSTDFCEKQQESTHSNMNTSNYMQDEIENYRSIQPPLFIDQLKPQTQPQQNKSILKQHKTQLLSSLTSSDQLTILRLLDQKSSEIFVKKLDQDLEIQVSTLKPLKINEKQPNSFNNQYILTYKFLILSSEIPENKQPKIQISPEITYFREQLAKNAQIQSQKAQNNLLNPYLPTHRSLSWLNLQFQDILLKLDQHYVNQQQKYEKYVKICHFQQKVPEQLKLTDFHTFLTEIYISSKIGLIQKNQLFYDEIRDSCGRFYPISAAARLISIFCDFELVLANQENKIPHRVQSVTLEEKKQIQEKQIFTVIVVELFKQLYNNSKSVKISTENFVIGLPESVEGSYFKGQKVAFPKQFESRILKFPISRPVLANNLLKLFKKWEVKFNMNSVVVEIERMSIFNQVKADEFEVEIYVLLEAILRVLIGFDAGFGGILTEKVQGVRKGKSIEEMLGIDE